MQVLPNGLNSALGSSPDPSKSPQFIVVNRQGQLNMVYTASSVGSLGMTINSGSPFGYASANPVNADDTDDTKAVTVRHLQMAGSTLPCVHARGMGMCSDGCRSPSGP